MRLAAGSSSFGKRWVFSPDVVVLGADGGDAETLRSAVLEAARAL
jgi:hypothetical protein